MVRAVRPRLRAAAAAVLAGAIAAAGITTGAAAAHGAQLATSSPVRITAAQGCAVADGALEWGFKEAFRSYLSGTIAYGEWTVSGGAAYETPAFRFADGEGDFDPATGEGLLGFAGSIRFTGHGGILDTTVSNPQVRMLGGLRGVLLLDVVGETQEGVAVDESAVEFADLDFAAATISAQAGVLSFEGVSVTLSEAGAAAFGTYSPGERFDDLDLSFVGVDCELVLEPGGPLDAGAGPNLAWLAWAVLAVALVLLALVLMRRARR